MYTLLGQFESITELENTQHAWLLFSLSLTKVFSHLARHIPPSIFLTAKERINNLLKTTSDKILSTTWTANAWAQANLPIKKSGMTIPNIRDISNCRYAASFREKTTPHSSLTFPTIGFLMFKLSPSLLFAAALKVELDKVVVG